MRLNSPLVMPLLVFLALVGCEADVVEHKDPSEDSGTDSAEDSAEDTGEALDEDKDGFNTTTDCDDNNFRGFPGAAELCNGLDENCDGQSDETFDVDGDGATDADACADGTDCADTDPTIGPAAVEVPYDGIDQDCDGADLIDVDGDRYDYTFDCDDNNPEINPGATEVAKNGLDDDCVDGDSLDGDGDGHDDEAWDGDDCDDADPDVHPGARDIWNDGIDPDCDGFDGGIEPIADASATIEGDASDQGLIGESVAWCDIDADGLDDLVVTAPFEASYAGQIGIWYGSGRPSWGPGMLMSDADTLIESSEQYLGFGLSCDDIDGDGNLDIVVSRGEIDYGATYQADYELVFFYGSGGTFGATLDDGDADAFLSYPLGAAYGATVYAQAFVTGDLDSDGASEIIVNDGAQDNLADPTGNLLVLRGERYSGDSDLDDQIIATIDTESEGVGRVRILDDLDADGKIDLFLGSANYEAEADTADGGGASGDTGADTGVSSSTAPAGRAFFSDSAMVDAAVSELVWRTWNGRDGDGYGWDLVLTDVSGDGIDDATVTAIGVGDYDGALYLFDGVPLLGSPADAQAELMGTTDEGYFGYEVIPAGDVDRDGYGDLLVSELYGGGSKEGIVWLVSGALAWSGVGDVESAALLAWSGEEAEAYTGNALAVGDPAGTGGTTVAVGAYQLLNSSGYTEGKVYILE